MVKSASSNDAFRVVGYARLSSGSDESTSIARQHQIITRHAAAKGWTLTEIIDDPIASATKLRLNRPGLSRVRAMIASGQAAAVVVWRMDRIARNVVDYGTLLDEGVEIVSATEELDTTTEIGKAIAKILQIFAEMEAKATSLRVASSVEYLRRNARFPGGVVPFGYDTAPKPDGPGRVLIVNRYEHAIVRQLAERVLDGESANSIATDLNARGVPTTRSEYRRARIAGKPTEGLGTGRWTTNILQLILTSDHLLGRVIHHGKLILNEDGLPARVWEPVLDLATLTRLRQHIRDPRERAKTIAKEKQAAEDAGVQHEYRERMQQRKRRASRLLSGVAFCAHCQSKMYVNTSNGKPVYACPRRTDPTCKGPRMTASIIEKLVEERFLAIVGPLPEVEIVEIVSDPGTREALAEVEAAIRETTGKLGDDDADEAALIAGLKALKARRAELQAIPATVTTATRATGRTFGEAYAESDSTDYRRGVLLKGLDHVAISSLSEGTPRKGTHAKRVAYYWRDFAEATAADYDAEATA